MLDGIKTPEQPLLKCSGVFTVNFQCIHMLLLQAEISTTAFLTATWLINSQLWATSKRMLITAFYVIFYQRVT